MARITKQDAQVQIDGINEILAKIEADYRLELNGRYNYTAIDRVKAEDKHISLGDSLVAGTMRECRDYAAAMLRGMWMVRGEM